MVDIYYQKQRSVGTVNDNSLREFGKTKHSVNHYITATIKVNGLLTIKTSRKVYE